MIRLEDLVGGGVRSRFGRLKKVVVDGRVVGLAVVDRDEDRLTLKFMYVRPEFRGKGYEERFFRWLVEEAGSMGVSEVATRCSAFSELCERVGFKREGGAWVAKVEKKGRGGGERGEQGKGVGEERRGGGGGGV